MLHSIKDTLNVGPDHVFGIQLKPDEYGAGDLLHNRVPGTYLRGRDQQRGLVAAMRQHLKKLNYHSFPDLIQAFRFYDKVWHVFTNLHVNLCDCEPMQWWVFIKLAVTKSLTLFSHRDYVSKLYMTKSFIELYSFIPDSLVTLTSNFKATRVLEML